MEISGIFMKKSEIREISDKFSVQECYVDCSNYNQFTGEKYENILKFQFANSKIEKIRHLQKGHRIKVKFMPQGRVVEKDDGDKFHVMNLNAWDVETINQNGSMTLTAQPMQPTQPTQTQDFVPLNMEDEDDLPF